MKWLETPALSAILIGVVAVLVVSLAAVVAIAAVGGDSGQTIASVAAAASGVVGSIVGAFFGVKVGGEGKDAALDEARRASTQAIAFAAHTHPEDIPRAMETMAGLSGQATARGATPGPPTGTEA